MSSKQSQLKTVARKKRGRREEKEKATCRVSIRNDFKSSDREDSDVFQGRSVYFAVFSSNTKY